MKSHYWILDTTPIAMHLQFWFSTEPEKRINKGFIFELIEGFRTEELSGSNLHKLSKSSYQKRTKIFSHFLYYYYTKSKLKCQKVDTDYYWSFQWFSTVNEN